MQIRFLITPNQELSVSMGLDRADGDTVALGAPNGVRQAGAVSNFEAVRCELGYRYSFAVLLLCRCPFQRLFLGAKLGLERHKPISVRFASGVSETLLTLSSGYG